MIGGTTNTKFTGTIQVYLIQPSTNQQLRFYNSLYFSFIGFQFDFRWVVGPRLEFANGGLMILTEVVCPWRIEFGGGKFDQSYIPGVLIENIFNFQFVFD